jgi:hypothetical protein
MGIFAHLRLAVVVGAVPVAASATNYTATPANFAAVFEAAQSGDSITLIGHFGSVTLADKAFAVPLRIDASGATFSDAMVIHNVSGVSFTGGYFGSTTKALSYNSAVVAYGDSNISFTKAYMVGAQTGRGIAYLDGTNLTVTASTFYGLSSGIDFGSSTGAVLYKNKSIHSSSDGFDIAGSHMVSITDTTCSGGAPSPGAHPDCVQLYSLAGTPPQSDITIANNVARGPTQGFTSFNAMDGGGLRIDMSDNIIATSYSQGLACYACVDSVFAYNTLTTLPGSMYKTNIHIIGGADNLIIGNTTDGAEAPDQTDSQTAALSPDLVTELGWTPADFAGQGTSSAPGDVVVTTLGQTVPEPASWALMLAGFGAIGIVMRRRPGAVAA